MWTQVNVFGNPRAILDSSQTPYQGILTGTLVAKGGQPTVSTIPMPIFARKPSTMKSFFPAQVPHNSMADQQRLQILELHFEKITTLSTFSCWKTRFKTQVSSCSDFPSEATS